MIAKKERKNKHGGRRKHQGGRPPLPEDQKMRRRPIGLLPEQWLRLKEQAATEGVSVDEIIRHLVDAGSKKERKP